MKKIFLILSLVSLNSFGESLLLKAPFTELNYENAHASAGRLVIPPMVAEDVYREAVAEDCRQYRETISQYSSHFSTAEITALVTEPLPYSMKKTYEVDVMFSIPKTADLKENGELLLHFNADSLGIEWREDDLLKNVLNPVDSILFSESSSAAKLKFIRRDLFCGYLSEKLKLKMQSTVYWSLTENQRNTTEQNLNLLFQAVKPVLKTEKGKLLTAALVGRNIHLVTRQPDFTAGKRFSSVDYIWNLLFESENSLEPSQLWNSSGGGVYLQNLSVPLELRGLQ